MSYFNKILIFIFLSFLIVILLVNVLKEDLEFSESENRLLAKKPELSVESILSGKFMTNFEDYVTDQFAFKDSWSSLKTKTIKALGKVENKGIIFGSDSYLFEVYKDKPEQIKTNIDYINKFSEKTDLPTSLLIAPTSISIYEESLPKYIRSDSQERSLKDIGRQLVKGLKFVNPYEEFRLKKEEELYYRTDHHWTSHGAYFAYQSLAESLDFDYYAQSDFTKRLVSGKFYGSFAAKAQDKSLPPDDIIIYEPKFPVNYTLEIEANGVKESSLYDWNYLNKRDKYSLFLHGNNSLVKITSSIKNDRRLLIFKDSYADALIPFLANHFEEIHIIDLRYFRQNVRAYIAEKEITEILYVYNLVNFSKDKNLAWLK